MLKLFRVILLFCFPLTVYAQSGLPVLQAGTVHVSGEVRVPDHLKKDSTWLWAYIPQPFTGENAIYKTMLGPDGRFTLTVDTQTDISRFVISTDIDITGQVTVLLKNGQENKISLNYNDDGAIDKVSSSENAGFTGEEMLGSQRKFAQIMAYKTSVGPIDTFYNKPVSAFIAYVDDHIQKKRAALNKAPLLSEKMGEIVFRDFSLQEYAGTVLDYRGMMELNYANRNNKRKPDSAEIKTPSPADYAFLKNLDLNNHLNLYCFSYAAFTQTLLKEEALGIPRIGDTPIPEWTKTVKKILAPLTGFDKGLFYDMLAANAYALQFEMEMQPLTAKQLANIRNYHKGGDLEKLLLRRNGTITEQARVKSTLSIQSVPAVPQEQLMEAIVAGYKGKVVVVDFWETWCAPCLQAMKESRDMKKELAGKEVVFVYIASTSSPRNTWEKSIPGIGGEQFYLNGAVRGYLSEKYKLTGVPSYLVFDKQGVLTQHFTGYPGNDAMLKLIGAAL